MTVSDILREHAIYSEDCDYTDLPDDVYAETNQEQRPTWYAMPAGIRRMYLCMLAEALENP